MEDLTLVAVVVVALFFDFTNGFHDTANAIATSVSTRALSPRVAVLVAAILNFAGAFVSLKVAATVAKGIVNPDAVTLSVILAGLVGAITWNLVTWFLGLPSSSSHALIGGIAGAAIAFDGWEVIEWQGVWDKVVKPGVLSPILGFLIALALMLVIIWIIRRRSPSRINRVFRRAQIVSGSFVAFTHGTNDAQKTMGVIALALISTGHMSAEGFDLPDLGHRLLGDRNGTRHLCRRVADHQDDGDAHREDRPAAGILGSDGDRRDPVDDRTPWLPGLDDADGHGLRDGRRSEPEVLRLCAGASPATLRWRGLSRCRPPGSSARSWKRSRECPPATSSCSSLQARSRQPPSLRAATRPAASFLRTPDAFTGPWQERHGTCTHRRRPACDNEAISPS